MFTPLLHTVITTFASANSQAACNASKSNTFFGLETWYKYLNVKYDSVTHGCSITNFTSAQGTQNVFGVHSPFLLIGLAVVDDLLRIAGLVAIAFVIIGAIQYITSQGNPEDTASAQGTIVNALIGLVVAVIAVGFITFIGSRLGG